MHTLLTLTLVAAAISWLLGHTSILGAPLGLREGIPWRAARWGGLGIVAIALLFRDQIPTAIAAFGAALLLLGTARKRVQASFRFPPLDPPDPPDSPRPPDAPVPAPLAPEPVLVGGNAKALPKE